MSEDDVDLFADSPPSSSPTGDNIPSTVASVETAFVCDEKARRKEELTNSKVFNDPIHGHIVLHPLCVKIIDTPQFQRLRNLKQLGACYFVFPGASHNRFEHSLGVCYLAGELVKHLQRTQPELRIDDKDVLCVQIAGLCHDLGHGPFSHLFDSTFIPTVNPGSRWKHEDASAKMLEYLIKDNNLWPDFEKYGLNKHDITFITEQIQGPKKIADHKHPYFGRDSSKGFLYEIVANKRNGIDVDKYDYFERDCHHLGVRICFDYRRFIRFARVIDVNGEKQICTRDKEAVSVYDMFHTRASLHRRAYQHKTTAIIHHMISEALVLANEHIFYKGKNGKLLKISDTIDDMHAYMQLDDTIFQRILHSTDPELVEAKEVLLKITRRQLYRFIGETKPKQNEDGNGVALSQPSQEFYLSSSSQAVRVNDETWKTSIENAINSPKQTEETESKSSDIIVLIAQFDYGMKDCNPAYQVHFYSKSNLTEAFTLPQNQVSEMLPNTFKEKTIRVYCKSTDPDRLKIVKEAFRVACEKNNYYSQPKPGNEAARCAVKRKHSQASKSESGHDDDDNESTPVKRLC